MFIPLCVWGMLSSLLMHLIELRSLFIAGGEWRLRVGVMAFAGGAILIQRLTVEQGKSHSRVYGWALGAAMTLFVLHNAFAYRLPVHPVVVFLVNEALFAVLWWVASRITESCSVDLAQSAAAADSGVLARRRRKGGKKQTVPTAEQVESRWTERLSPRHPGRVIFMFSLIALPVFGIGTFIFDPSDVASIRLGVFLFAYLWCALSLLFLSSFSQLRHYFQTRGASMPDAIGVAWLAIGFVVVALVMVAAFFLPQPASVASIAVQNRVVASYRGWENRYGVSDTSSGRGGRRTRQRQIRWRSGRKQRPTGVAVRNFGRPRLQVPAARL